MLATADSIQRSEVSPQHGRVDISHLPTWNLLGLCDACRQSMQAGQVSAQAGAQKLQQLQASGLQLATHSLQLMSLSDPKEQQAYAASSRDAANKSLSFITCMGVIRQTADEVSLCTASSLAMDRQHNQVQMTRHCRSFTSHWACRPCFVALLAERHYLELGRQTGTQTARKALNINTAHGPYCDGAVVPVCCAAHTA
jgi:hypothetical protein